MAEVPPGRQLVVDVFGDSCPVCGHSVDKVHDFWSRCTVCDKDCGNSVWPPESVQRFKTYHDHLVPAGSAVVGEKP